CFGAIAEARLIRASWIALERFPISVWPAATRRRWRARKSATQMMAAPTAPNTPKVRETISTVVVIVAVVVAVAFAAAIAAAFSAVASAAAAVAVAATVAVAAAVAGAVAGGAGGGAGGGVAAAASEAAEAAAAVAAAAAAAGGGGGSRIKLIGTSLCLCTYPITLTWVTRRGRSEVDAIGTEVP
ncbi:unnamed protein product, partial [Clonostachys solani]